MASLTCILVSHRKCNDSINLFCAQWIGTEHGSAKGYVEQFEVSFLTWNCLDIFFSHNACPYRHRKCPTKIARNMLAETHRIYEQLMPLFQELPQASPLEWRKGKTTEIYQKLRKMSSRDRRNHASRDARKLLTSQTFILVIATGKATRMTERKRNHRDLSKTMENVQPESQEPCQQRSAEFI